MPSTRRRGGEAPAPGTPGGGRGSPDRGNTLGLIRRAGAAPERIPRDRGLGDRAGGPRRGPRAPHRSQPGRPARPAPPATDSLGGAAATFAARAAPLPASRGLVGPQGVVGPVRRPGPPGEGPGD